MSKSKADVIVIGAGIVGLACAYEAASRGMRVIVIERDKEARGASARGFGLLWQSGLAAELLPLAQASLKAWRTVIAEVGLWSKQDGALTVAGSETEAQVLRELAERAPDAGYAVRFLDPKETAEKSPAVIPSAVFGSLFGTAGVGVDPGEVLTRVPQWLANDRGVEFRFGHAVASVEMPRVTCTCGDVMEAPRVIVATGDRMDGLFPGVFAKHGIKACKVQMLQTVEQPRAWDMGPSIALGVSTRMADSCQSCPSIDALRGEIAARAPEMDRFGIQPLLTQHADGSVCIGGSHEYGDAADEPFDKEVINEIVLRELKKCIQLRDWTIEYRWVGRYVRSATRSLVVEEVQPGCKVAVGAGGSGLTLAFGHAKNIMEGW